MKFKKAAAITGIVAVIALFYWPLGRWLVQSWLSNPYYSHGFLVPPVSGFFIWNKRRELIKGEPSLSGIFILALGILVYILGLVWGIRFLAAFSLLPVLGGLVLFIFGRGTARSLLFPLGFLLFMIPLPYIQEIGFFLQNISVNAAAWLLAVMGLAITTSGTEIHLGNDVFTVGLACSGINTLIALLALVLVYLYLLTGPFYRKTLLFLIAFPVAVLANVLRITAIILVAGSFGAAAAMGVFHDLSSIVFFIIAFLILVLLARLLRCKIKVHAS